MLYVYPVEAASPPPRNDTVDIDSDQDEATLLASPIPTAVEVAGHALASLSAPTGTAIFTLGFNGAAVADAVVPRLPSPTPAVVEIEGDALAYESAPTGASIFTIGSDVRTLTSAPAVPPSSPRADVDGPRLLSPTPATPPPSPRAGARRRLLALGLPLASPSADSPTRSRGRRTGTWSPTALGLANGAFSSVAPGTRLPGGSSNEEEGSGSAARRR